MNKREKIAKLARDKVKANCLYMWGGQGESVLETSPKDIIKHETNKTNAARILKLLANKLITDQNMSKAEYFDCSGLVVDILRKLEIIGPKDDFTAADIYKKLCAQICKDNLKEGDLVFVCSGTKINHVGIYTGPSEVTEAAGRDLGVLTRPMSKNSWNLFGRVKINEK